MSEFEIIKNDHFRNIPYTKKQITDIYNDIYGTSKQEQNLVFLETKSIVLSSGLSIKLDSEKYIGFLHYTIQGHNSKWNIGYLPTQLIDFVGADGNWSGDKNLFFLRLGQISFEGIFVYSVFKFA